MICATHKFLDLPTLIGLKSVFAALHKTPHPASSRDHVRDPRTDSIRQQGERRDPAGRGERASSLRSRSWPTISASAVKSAFEDSITNTRALLGAKDVQEFVSAAERLRPARHREGHRLLEERVRSRHRSQHRAQQGRRAPRLRVERRLRHACSTRCRRTPRPARTSRSPRSSRCSPPATRPTTTSPRSRRQATEIAEANVSRRDRDGEGPREGKKSRLSAKPGKKQARPDLAPSAAPRSRS